MKKMTSTEIRNMYLKYFEERGHKVIESAPLIPRKDPTLLWINCGMTPLKKYFDGSAIPENRRMVGYQKCIRTNDIDNVGKTARHHTFFEMLGNFSIGDYFKKEAINFSYELLTSEQYFGFDKDKLYVTIYSKDDEAHDLWVEAGINPSHIVRLEDNFWEIGEGPSGPNTEIFFDRGEEYDTDKKGIKLLEEGIDNERYVEIWNNVLSQYNAIPGVNRNDYPELPSKNIDTGMGLERMACIIQNAPTNYETDLFMPIIKKIEEISGNTYDGSMPFKVIADHIRAIAFAISDGATFSNEGRGYVIRRLLRRAVLYGRKLGINEPFIQLLAVTVADNMKDVYPNLESKLSLIETMIASEEQLFHRTLLDGEKKLHELMNKSESKVISGEDAFKLYDTYGFPFELTKEYLEEKGYKVSEEDFNAYMEDQKGRARQARKNEDSMNTQDEVLLNYTDISKFVGYDNYEHKTKVIGIIKDGNLVDSIEDNGYIVLEETPFYAEAGGQVADIGIIQNENMESEVTNVIKAPHKQHLHFVNIKSGNINIGDLVDTKIDIKHRESIAKNHSAAHLLQKALQDTISKDIHQMGSKVDANVLRFDFICPVKITDEELIKIEALVNEKINTKVDAKVEEMSLDEAKEKGAMALFEEKYSDKVRVVTLSDSIELCGGTHVKNIGDINKFAIKYIESKGANIYRIEATTNGNVNFELFNVIEPYDEEMIKLLKKAENIIQTAKDEGVNLNIDVSYIKTLDLASYKDVVRNRSEIAATREKVKDLEKEYIKQHQNKLLSDLSSFDNLIQKSQIGEYIITKVDNYDMELLKRLIDNLVEKLNNGFVFIANVCNNNVNYMAKANKNIIDKIDTGLFIKEASLASSGNGGGSKIFGQGGGSDTSRIDEIMNNINNKLKDL
jgi:alanyl-tRNA synthetase